MSRMRIVTIRDIVEDVHHTKTFRFEADFEAKPGQFIMCWIPGVDEVPMALSYLGKMKGVTVHNVGGATTAMHNLRIGDKIGFRGPFGNSFEFSGKEFLLVSGGTGTSSVIAAAEALGHMGKEVVSVIGAKTKDELLFVDRAKMAGEVYMSTDDGSAGYHGFASSLASELLQKRSFDRIVTCGPEKMMKKVVELAIDKGIDVQVSLERYMKCGIGLCDSCAFNGFLVCSDGPVFNGRDIIGVEDFGQYRRDRGGRRVRI